MLGTILGFKIVATGATFTLLGIFAAIISIKGGKTYSDKAKAFLGLCLFGGAIAMVIGILIQIWY